MTTFLRENAAANWNRLPEPLSTTSANANARHAPIGSADYASCVHSAFTSDNSKSVSASCSVVVLSHAANSRPVAPARKIPAHTAKLTRPTSETELGGN